MDGVCNVCGVVTFVWHSFSRLGFAAYVFGRLSDVCLACAQCVGLDGFARLDVFEDVRIYFFRELLSLPLV